MCLVNHLSQSFDMGGSRNSCLGIRTVPYFRHVPMHVCWLCCREDVVSLHKQGMLALWEQGGCTMRSGICALHSRISLQEVFHPLTVKYSCCFLVPVWGLCILRCVIKTKKFQGKNNSFFIIWVLWGIQAFQATTDFKLRHYYFVTDEWKIALWDCISLVLYMLGEVQRY